MGNTERMRICIQNEKKPKNGLAQITGACIDGNRKLDAQLCLGRSQVFVNKNLRTSTVQLQSLRGCLAVIPYRRWNFRTLDVSKASIKQERQGSETYIQFPKEIENGDGAWKSFGSIPNLEERLRKG